MDVLFPWMRALSPADQAECTKNILDAARTSVSTEQADAAVDAELTSWRETATAIAAGLGSQPGAWLDRAEPVERP